MINNAYAAEVEGKSKAHYQIDRIPNAFVIKDGVAIGSEGVAPLWILGLMY